MSFFAHYHYIFVHFPIALIIMAGVAESIMCFRKNVPLNNTVNFLLISALVFTIPTIGTGLLLEDTGIVGEQNHSIFEWHESFAFITLTLTVVTIFLRYSIDRYFIYCISLIFLVISVSITAYFGGLMAF